MRFILAATALTALAACTTTDITKPVDTSASAPETVIPSDYALAMETVDSLIDAGNEQMAIDRLTQLLGNPSLTTDELAKALFARGELRYGNGNDLWGAIEDFDELVTTYPDSAEADKARALRAIAADEANTLVGQVTSGGVSPTEEFEYLFRLGEHQEAADLMLERSLQPENEYLVDFYQMGYLCDDPNLTGPSYALSEPDGTQRTVRFCEFGK